MNTTGFLPLQNSFNSEGPDALLFLHRSVQSFVFFSDSKRRLGIVMQYIFHKLTSFSSL
ncbi:hypothetical protein [Holospora obtusa]|uniref:hypothetical protein n=1 Tax=Holospora obtusa TaxID=49893 RepID=UPI000407E562|nr:hypothetical protein [Holospora obtusa]